MAWNVFWLLSFIFFLTCLAPILIFLDLHWPTIQPDEIQSGVEALLPSDLRWNCKQAEPA